MATLAVEGPQVTWALKISGGTPDTAYVVEVTGPAGATSTLDVMTDTAGDGTAAYVPDGDGTYTAKLHLNAPPVESTIMFEVKPPPAPPVEPVPATEGA